MFVPLSMMPFNSYTHCRIYIFSADFLIFYQIYFHLFMSTITRECMMYKCLIAMRNSNWWAALINAIISLGAGHKVRTAISSDHSWMTSYDVVLLEYGPRHDALLLSYGPHMVSGWSSNGSVGSSPC
jgi:hypothetical protein